MLEPLVAQKFDNTGAVSITKDLLSLFRKRRTTRHFSEAPVDREIILNAIATAGTAPNGANKQAWTFAIVTHPELKAEFRRQAEQEEAKFYHEQAPESWLNDLKPLHTNEEKEFITTAPYLIPVLYRNYDLDEQGNKSTNYYAKESVGLATGFLLASLHMAGLSTLTYTPSNSKYLVDLLDRPKHEHVFMVVVVGRPAEDAKVPSLTKKSLEQITALYEAVPERKIESAKS